MHSAVSVHDDISAQDWTHTHCAHILRFFVQFHYSFCQDLFHEESLPIINRQIISMHLMNESMYRMLGINAVIVKTVTNNCSKKAKLCYFQLSY